MNRDFKKMCEKCMPLCVVVLGVCLAVFSSDIEFHYPEFLRKALDEPLFKFAVLILISVVSYINFTCGLLLAMIFVFSITNVGSMSTLNEGFESGSPVAHCGTYNNEQTKKVGTVFYPMHDNDTVRKVRGGDDKTMDKF